MKQLEKMGMFKYICPECKRKKKIIEQNYVIPVPEKEKEINGLKDYNI